MKSYPGTSHFTVRSNELDYRGRVTMPTLVSYMQEAAWENTRDLGISMYDLLERGLTWVLQRMRVEMLRYPEHGESITVETWASGRQLVSVPESIMAVEVVPGQEPLPFAKGKLLQLQEVKYTQ